MLGLMKLHIEADLCRDCEACMLVCSLLHEGESNPLLSRVLVRKDMQRFKFNIILCQQCQTSGDSPECMQACPSEAIFIAERGGVIIDYEICVDCGDCAEACPYQAIFYNPETGKYYKCDLCADVAEAPACVEICPVEALSIRQEAVA
jgi:Fe-S-cluster-containing dehydrogenase component